MTATAMQTVGLIRKTGFGLASHFLKHFSTVTTLNKDVKLPYAKKEANARKVLRLLRNLNRGPKFNPCEFTQYM